MGLAVHVKADVMMGQHPTELGGQCQTPGLHCHSAEFIKPSCPIEGPLDTAAFL